MALSWDQISELELAQRYPETIDALEQRLREFPQEAEAVIRLGFNLWYVVAEQGTIGGNLPFEQYAIRFMKLFNDYGEMLGDHADFCWVFGQGIQMFFFYFPGATEELGTRLIEKACQLDPMWSAFWRNPPPDTSRLRGRGIFQIYCTIP